MWYNVVKGVCWVPSCTFLLDKWILEKCSLPYSLLLDYSTFEFTTLPYPTRNWKTTTLQGLVMACCLQNFSDYWTNNDRSWKNATTAFSLHTFIFMMTRGEKQQSLTSHFSFLALMTGVGKKQQLFCLYTFTFTMTGTRGNKGTNCVSTLSHSWRLSCNKSQGLTGTTPFPRAGIYKRARYT